MFQRKTVIPTITFATSVWEKDWRHVLLNPDYLRVRQIENHVFPFAQKILVINNVLDFDLVQKAAEQKVQDGVLTGYVRAEQISDEVFSFFCLKRSDFQPEPDTAACSGVSADWLYYNALGPLTALYIAKTEYLLYVTGDVRLENRVDWISKTIRRMAKDPMCKVANLVWNDRYDEARRESYRRTWNFYFAAEGFSDQMFLVKTADFRQPIYGEIRSDGNHFPRGDVWEKRVFSYMKNRGWERMIFRRGSYRHENF